MSMKTCTAGLSNDCIREAPRDEFKHNYCKACYKAYMAQYYIKNRNKFLMNANLRYYAKGVLALLAPPNPHPQDLSERTPLGIGVEGERAKVRVTP
jgi:hypothetical protein